ncbi:RodZ domain-containing protein [Candidatus Pelagadaptatus aseana]|uniref:RodZ domain-containing protein n=1 Tax=Candidatus Pelagadaptatus aseana TaxID=3120508 RepID=UPI003C6FC2A0
MDVTSDNNSMTPGQNLKQARQAAEMTEEQVAEHLKITVTYIRALEADEYHNLPDTPYVVGYLRSYSRLVEVDTDTLLDAFQQHQQQAPNNEAAESESEKLGGRFPFKQGLKIGVAVLVIWALAVWLFGSGDEPQSTLSEAKILPAQEVKPTVAVPEPDSENTQTADDAEADNGSQSSQQANATQDIKAEEAVSSAVEEVTSNVVDAIATDEQAVQSQQQDAGSSQEQQSPAMDTLVLNFSDECWLEITDANGDVLAADLYQAGDRFEAAGKAPFAVMMGNVRAAQVLFNGKPFTLQPNGFRKTLRTVIE